MLPVKDFVMSLVGRKPADPELEFAKTLNAEEKDVLQQLAHAGGTIESVSKFKDSAYGSEKNSQNQLIVQHFQDIGLVTQDSGGITLAQKGRRFTRLLGLDGITAWESAAILDEPERDVLQQLVRAGGRIESVAHLRGSAYGSAKNAQNQIIVKHFEDMGLISRDKGRIILDRKGRQLARSLRLV